MSNSLGATYLNSMVLDRTKIEFPAASVVDDFGSVFLYQGRVFRGVYHSQKDYCEELINSIFFKELIDENLIPNTWISELVMDEFAFVLEHEYIQASKPHHWSFSMLKDAALLMLKLSEKCSRNGYELKDAHAYNIFFKNNSPIFIDFGSLRKAESEKWKAYEEFVHSFYMQLLIWAKGDFFLARKLMEDGNAPSVRTVPMTRILDSMFMEPIRSEIFQYSILLKNRQIASRTREVAFLKRIFDFTNSLASALLSKKVKLVAYKKELRSTSEVMLRILGLDNPKMDSFWGGYHDYYKVNGVVSPRFSRLLELVRMHASSSESFLDLAGNQGFFSTLLHENFPGKRILLTDYDSNAIDQAYQHFKSLGLPIHPYVFNFMFPLESNEIKIFKSDVVFALAITHHLILTQKYSLRSILEIVSKYSNKFVVIEFMPMGLWDGTGPVCVPDWYTTDWFRKAFENEFELLAEEKLEPNRLVFLGKKVDK
jgi:hypothetical protein